MTMNVITVIQNGVMEWNGELCINSSYTNTY